MIFSSALLGSILALLSSNAFGALGLAQNPAFLTVMADYVVAASFPVILASIVLGIRWIKATFF